MAAPGRPPRVAFLTALACAVSACGVGHRAAPEATSASPTAAISSPAPASPTSSPRVPRGLPDLSRLDQSDATAVSKAALTLMWTVDSAIDHGQQDAYQRATPLLDSVYKAVIDGQGGGSMPGLWSRHRAYAKVRLTRQTPLGDVPADTPKLAHRQWRIDVTPTGRDGWKGDPVHATAFVTLRRDKPSGPWRVSAVGTT
ncbi:hypothetical protein [Actinomadura nitritigenes]|uniref:Uncharacterized protein n=1 Tax=Actinomadura nitritigenes TaxID=134602 RepID=A0ABS3R9Z7_9ACTN|nr:hypothetical protein [Actinomadura nitritigenes]MBO2443069.1 hypothetical protein [Actinomadura nitritigenes]